MTQKVLSKFAIVDDGGEILHTENTLKDAVEWVNAGYDAEESEDLVIIEIANVYQLEASKVSASKMKLDEYTW